MGETPKVQIQYTHSSLVSRFGAKPFEVSIDLAKQYENKGLARIITQLPDANPSLSEEEIKGIENKYIDDSVPYMPEQELLAKVVWISGGYLDRQVSETGRRFGYEIIPIYPGNFSPGKLFMGDLIILNSDLRGFSGAQVIQMKSTLFQKQRPYVYRMINEIYDVSWERHALLHSRLNIFVNEKLFDDALELYDDMIGDNWFIESKTDDLNTQFWVSIQRVLEGLS